MSAIDGLNELEHQRNTLRLAIEALIEEHGADWGVGELDKLKGYAADIATDTYYESIEAAQNEAAAEERAQDRADRRAYLERVL